MGSIEDVASAAKTFSWSSIWQEKLGWRSEGRQFGSACCYFVTRIDPLLSIRAERVLSPTVIDLLDPHVDTYSYPLPPSGGRVEPRRQCIRQD